MPLRESYKLSLKWLEQMVGVGKALMRHAVQEEAAFCLGVYSQWLYSH